jgi:hypothetical protein
LKLEVLSKSTGELIHPDYVLYNEKRFFWGPVSIKRRASRRYRELLALLQSAFLPAHPPETESLPGLYYCPACRCLSLTANKNEKAQFYPGRRKALPYLCNLCAEEYLFLIPVHR